MKISILDLTNFEIDKVKFSNNLGKSFQEIGFVIIKNHNISLELILNIYNYMYDFFDLPTNEKIKYHDRKNKSGYTPLGLEHAKNSILYDNKEFLHFTNKKDQLKLPFFDNNSMNKLFESFEKLASVIMRSIAIYLDLPENYFNEMLIDGESVLRCLHYPPTYKTSTIRAGAHEDINLITLLVGASAGGLQVLSKNEWLDINPPHDTIVVNIGDMLQRLTNGKLKSTTHRVISDNNLIDKSRYSMPFFMHPNSKTSLNCIESCINKTNPKSYEDITAGEFLNQRLYEIGLIT